ncbi:IclR family transcriptional regulator [Natrialba asiatica]|uniref:IclR family transcriptional regulator n=1 Tax=Natrialba asiatica (strain ATCC 700177 / DSM 12278 / JCM 9576 / FERM P-10747 / NBRC 102637 / 172P1) TaxID=29540 RepID=M0B3S8_NATA1|nr:IclR family transcriptional regulator [Natrialba asiatica]ELZ05197.1 IclR family transcriptional regulator [Natrialba asiatica DSM 12278]
MENRDIDGRSIKSDETLFAIIECLKRTNGAGVTELADRLDLAKSTVHKHLVALERHRYVVKEDGQYRLGLQFFTAGIHVRNQYEVYHAAKNRVDRLAAETNEAAWLIVHENGMGMFVYGVAHNEAFTFDSTIGTWVYLHANSAGKAILAHLPDEEVSSIIDRHGLPAQTENTITDRETLLDELAEVRDRGYAMNAQEDLRGLHAIASPVITDGRPVAAVTIAGAANRVTEERIEDDLSERLLEAVDDIELRLVYG